MAIPVVCWAIQDNGRIPKEKQATICILLIKVFQGVINLQLFQTAALLSFGNLTHA